MATSTRRILKKVASLLGKERMCPPVKDKDDDSLRDCRNALTHTTAGSAGDTPLDMACNGTKEFFFARVPSTVTYEELHAVFSTFGEVEILNLFKPFAEAMTSKGCGIVRYVSSTAAAAAKAELHDKYRWSPDHAPMMFERVNEKKKRSNISNGGTNELIFAPKFSTKIAAKGSNRHDSTGNSQQQSHLGSTKGSCCSLSGPNLQSQLSQSSSCSVASFEGGPMRYYSFSSMGSASTAGSNREQQGRLSANGFARQFASAADPIHSGGCDVIRSGSLLQSAAADAALMQNSGRFAQNQVCSGSVINSGQVLSSGQLLASGQPLGSGQVLNSGQLLNSGQVLTSGQLLLGEQAQQCGLDQQQQQQQQRCFALEAGAQGQGAGGQAGQQGRMQQKQQWQEWQLGMGPTAHDEGFGDPQGAAFMPSFQPLQPLNMAQLQAQADAAMAAGMHPSCLQPQAMQPTSLSILAGGQHEQLGMQLPFSGLNTPAAAVVGLHHPGMFDGLQMLPAMNAAGDLLGLPPMPFNSNTECLSTYSNFMEGHPSMQLARATGCGQLASISSAGNCVDAAAAADCSARLMSSSGLANCSMQQQQQLQAHPCTHQSGSNLQLTTGAMCYAAGATWEGVEDLNSLQQMHLLQLDGAWPGDSGYFDLYKSGSSLDSMKADEGGAFSSSSYQNKMSSCGSTDTRPNSNATAATTAAASRQQDQLLSMYQQGKLPQMDGMGGAGSAMGPGTCPGDQPLQWALQQQQQQPSLLPVSNSMLHGSQGMSGTVAGLPLGGSSGKAGEQQDLTEQEVPATSQAVAAVVEHIPSITAMTGAMVLVGSAPNGQLSFKLLGTSSQVQMAQGVIHLLLQKQQQQQREAQ